MAHGLPDYYRGVDIAYQALGEMIVRPKYGAARTKTDSKVLTPNDTTVLVTDSGRGVIYGGSVYLNPAASQKTGIIHLLIDSRYVSFTSIYGLKAYALTKPWTSSLYLLTYDDVSFEYSVGISPGITFESSFQVEYLEDQNKNPTVLCSVVYALIE